MMKSKRKAPPTNFLARFWHEFLFMREFEYMIQAEPERCAQVLKTDFPYMYLTKHTPLNYSFALYTNDMVGATGTLEYDGDQAATILQGYVQFDLHRYTLILGVGVVFVLGMAAFAAYFNMAGAFVGILVLIFALWWWIGYQDRNRLIGAIHQAVEQISSYTSYHNLLEEPEKQKIGQDDLDDTHTQAQSTSR